MSNDTVEAIRTRLNVLQKIKRSAEEEITSLSESLVRVPNHYQSVEDRWESLRSFILTYLEKILKIHRVTPNIEVIRIVVEVKYEACNREVLNHEWSLWLPLVEDALIPHFEKVIVTGKHDSFSPHNLDMELIQYLIRAKRLQFVCPR